MTDGERCKGRTGRGHRCTRRAMVYGGGCSQHERQWMRRMNAEKKPPAPRSVAERAIAITLRAAADGIDSLGSPEVALEILSVAAALVETLPKVSARWKEYAAREKAAIKRRAEED